MKVSIEQLAFSIKNENIKFDEEISDEIKFALKRFSTSAKRICSSHRNRALHKTLKNLSKDNEIKICKFDKGKGIAILDSSDYYSKLDSIVLDQSKFIQINQNTKVHPIISKEKSVTYFIRKYLKNYDSEVIRKLIPSGSKPGRIYGLVKVHKNNYPLRPVISMIDSPEYELAKFMDSLIKPLVPNKYMLNSTDDFLMKLNNSNISSNDKLVSFDVVSLFTNIPLNETINIIADYVFSDENIQKPLMEKHIFVKLLRLTCEGLFLYNDCLYKQIDGVAMGSPLGPTLANFFLAHIETKKLLDSSMCPPKFYSRFVDDCFAVFDSDISSLSFLNLLNSQHKNIKFTMESAVQCISFLDVSIKVNNDKIETWIWRKPTHTGLLLNYNAYCPKKWKSGLISCLLHRAKLICSNNLLFLNEVGLLRNVCV